MSRNNGQPDSRLWTASVAFASLCIAFYILSPSIADPDLWGHVLFGLDTLGAGGPLRTDPYSYLTAGREWINHEWLAELAFAGAYRLGGTQGLVALRLSIVAAIAVLILQHLHRAGVPPARGGVVLFFVCYALTPGLGTVRPQMFTFILFLATLLILDAAEKGRGRWLLLIPPLFALWINFHGGVLAGLGVVGIWATARLWGERKPGDADGREAGARRVAVPLLVVAGAGLALLVNPYGWKLPAFLLETATVPRNDIVEWRPLSLSSLRGITYLALLAIAVFALVNSRARRQPSMLLILGITALLPFAAVRHLQLFALAHPIILAPHLASSAARRAAVSASPAEGSSPRIRAWIAGLAMVSGLAFLGLSAPNLRCVRVDAERSIAFPTRAVALLESGGAQGNLATMFGWGEYAIWHLQPRVKVAMDGRRETVYSAEVYEEFLRFAKGVGEWDALLDERPTEMALVSKRWPVFNLLRLKPGWSLVYEDSVGGLFLPDESPLAPALAATPVPEVPVDGAGLCAP